MNSSGFNMFGSSDVPTNEKKPNLPNNELNFSPVEQCPNTTVIKESPPKNTLCLTRITIHTNNIFLFQQHNILQRNLLQRNILQHNILRHNIL